MTPEERADEALATYAISLVRDMQLAVPSNIKERFVKHIKEVQREAVERTRKYLISCPMIEGFDYYQSLVKAVLELTPDKVLEE